MKSEVTCFVYIWKNINFKCTEYQKDKVSFLVLIKFNLLI